MNLGELLEELRENILHDRSHQISGDTDQLWSDKTLTRYINQAERRMARRALLLRDGTTPEVIYVQTIADQREYTLHPKIIAVLSARCLANTNVGILHDDRADLARAGHAAFSTYHQPDSYFFDPSTLSNLPPGKIMAFDTDETLQQGDEGTFSAISMRVYPKPTASFVQPIKLRVLRLPLRKLEQPTDIPEIPEDYHLDMLDWAAYLALRIIDRDQGDAERAAEFKASFEAHVMDARREMMRKLFVPAPWGFGRNGFSWETN